MNSEAEVVRKHRQLFQRQTQSERQAFHESSSSLFAVYCHAEPEVHSYGHLPVISGYKWDYAFYKWGYKYL
jgi:hypothetical protein